MRLAHVVGKLGRAHDLVVGAHLSRCAECRARAEADMVVGGQFLEALPPARLAPGALERTMERLGSSLGEDDVSAGATEPPPVTGELPAALGDLLRAARLRWLAPGIRQAILLRRADGMLRMLRVRPGKALPRHGHSGTELTLVLEGSFADETGRYGPGDLAEAGEGFDHQPIADGVADCLCLVATFGPLRYRGLLGGVLRGGM